ncbi:MAG: AMP-binding protein [Pseudomonadota bacterium]
MADIDLQHATARDWHALRAAHRWVLPPDYNLAQDMVGKWAASEPERLALIHLDPEGREHRHRYIDLDRAANRLANALTALGVGPGDRVAVLLAQSPEVIHVHLAAARMGAIAVPLFTLFGEEALEYRLAHSGAKAVLTSAADLPKIAAIRARLPALAAVLSVDGPEEGVHGLDALLAEARDRFTPVATTPETPVLISYTSGTTGPPKGALHAHRVLLGHVPGVQLVHEFFPAPGDAMWTPADWAWMGGLCNIAMPALRFGVPLLAHRMERFDPERAFGLMARYGIRNAFLPPTALKLMRRVERPERFGARLRSVGSGGESLGDELIAWGRETLGLTINEFYGQTECNKVAGSCAGLGPPRSGAMGRALPGSEVGVLDAEGQPVPPGVAGEIAVKRGDAAMFLGYWQDEARTAAKFTGEWMLTGDEATMDAEGYIRFASRTDDVITSSGYRIGPTEIEHCLVGHAAVAMAAVIGVPDPVRTETVKAFVTLAPGHTPSDDLAASLTAHVRLRLSPHLAPREVAFLERMPTTATGKILRRALRDAQS